AMTTKPEKQATTTASTSKPTDAAPTATPSPVETAEAASPAPPKLIPLPGAASSTESVGQNGDKHARATALVKLARKAQDAGDWKKAVELALQAQALNVEFAPNEDSPEKIFAAHEALRDRLNDRKSAGQSSASAALARKHMDSANRHLAG